MISTIIINYHCFEQTHKSVNSVINESDEVIVIDNSESDEEFENLRTIESKKVKCIKNISNVGFAKACNQAYLISKGKYILFLNPDAYFTDNSVTYLKIFLENSNAAAVGPKMFWDDEKKYYLPPTTFPSLNHQFQMALIQKSKILYELYLKNYRKNFLKLIYANRPIKQHALSGGHFMIKRDVIESLGYLFDERFFMYYEDSDLMLRLKRKNFEVYIEPKAGVVHNYLITFNKNKLMANAGKLYYDKNFSNSSKKILNKLQKNIKEFLTYEDLGNLSSPFTIDLNTSENLFFEFSPVSNFIPNIISKVNDSNFTMSDEVWKFLSEGNYFYRFFDKNTLKTIGTNYKFNKVISRKS